MKWRRETFSIITKREDTYAVESVSGYIAEDGEYVLGIHKNRYGVWTLTDVTTGARIPVAYLDDTLKGLKEYTERHISDIERKIERGYQWYPDRVAAARALLA